MIGTIRKHSKVLWWTIVPLTIITFVIFMGQGGARNGGQARAGLGTIYGQTVTPETLDAAKRAYFIDYWLRRQQFPDRDPSLTRLDIDRDIYERLILTGKAKQLGIHVSEDAQVAGANSILRSIGRNGEAVPMDAFVSQVLQPEGLTPADFQRFVEDDLAIQQLINTLGMSGALVTPQDASQIYDRDHQEVSAQAVFFSGTNYISQVPVTPAAVGLFYTNYMAHYRLNDRVRVNYVTWELSNFLAAAEQKIGKTNITAEVESAFAKDGMKAVPSATTPDEAKAKIRELILRRYAAAAAADEAKQFIKELFAMEPVSGANLVTLAKTKGLTVRTSAPFDQQTGPEEFPGAAETITTEAFKLNPDSPFPERPVPGSDTLFVIGLAQQLPSEVPPLSEIHDRVAKDYQYHEAAIKARTVGTNFFINAAVQMAAGKSFAQVALASGLTPFALKPFSLASQDIPEAEGHANIGEIKNAAFTTQPGHVSPFVPTAEGGFVLFVQSMLPVNESEKTSEMPRFLAQLRRSRENEAFNLWLNAEANRELRNTPVFAELMGAGNPAPGNQ